MTHTSAPYRDGQHCRDRGEQSKEQRLNSALGAALAVKVPKPSQSVLIVENWQPKPDHLMGTGCLLNRQLWFIVFEGLFQGMEDVDSAINSSSGASKAFLILLFQMLTLL